MLVFRKILRTYQINDPSYKSKKFHRKVLLGQTAKLLAGCGRFLRVVIFRKIPGWVLSTFFYLDFYCDAENERRHVRNDTK